MSDRTKTSMVLFFLLLAAAIFLIPWGRESPPEASFALSTADWSAFSAPDGVSLFVDDLSGQGELVATLQNDGPAAFVYADDLFESVTLELFRADAWYTVPVAEDALFAAISYMLEPGGRGELRYPQSMVPELMVGRHRMIVRLWPMGEMGGGPFAVMAEFDVLPG